jgi:hypothetical protein
MIRFQYDLGGCDTPCTDIRKGLLAPGKRALLDPVKRA